MRTNEHPDDSPRDKPIQRTLRLSLHCTSGLDGNILPLLVNIAEPRKYLGKYRLAIPFSSRNASLIASHYVVASLSNDDRSPVEL
jgi:hypothetical protein